MFTLCFFYYASYPPKFCHAFISRLPCLAPKEFKKSKNGPWPKKVVHHWTLLWLPVLMKMRQLSPVLMKMWQVSLGRLWLISANTRSFPVYISGLFIHSGHFYSASSSPILLRGAPDTARILCWSLMPKCNRQVQAKNLPKVPTWWLERGLNSRPFGRRASTPTIEPPRPTLTR